LESLSAGLEAAGDDVFNWQFRVWYSPYSQLLKTELGNLLAGRSDAAGFLAAMQAETDRLAADANVTKYSR
jgi:N-acetylglucosamine transport system substrate-binding protein